MDVTTVCSLGSNASQSVRRIEHIPYDTVCGMEGARCLLIISSISLPLAVA